MKHSKNSFSQSVSEEVSLKKFQPIGIRAIIKDVSSLWSIIISKEIDWLEMEARCDVEDLKILEYVLQTHYNFKCAYCSKSQSAQPSMAMRLGLNHWGWACLHCNKYNHLSIDRDHEKMNALTYDEFRAIQEKENG